MKNTRKFFYSYYEEDDNDYAEDDFGERYQDCYGDEIDQDAFDAFEDDIDAYNDWRY